MNRPVPTFTEKAISTMVIGTVELGMIRNAVFAVVERVKASATIV
jgi:hypothetical protein